MPTEPLTAARLLVTGRVQGLGVRPAVVRFARQLGLKGCVANSSSGLLIEIEGPQSVVERFEKHWLAAMPVGMCAEDVCCEPLGVSDRTSFEIVASGGEGAIIATVPIDLVNCDDCIKDMLAGRRRDYAFTSCTHCGPRYSIIQSMPYDRATTSMADFKLCSACESEYVDEHDRRFHAQTNACPECGPRLVVTPFMGSTRRSGPDESGHYERRDAPGSIDAAVAALLKGEIVALKGLGGYQLLVDATSDAAVARLRCRKGRHSKPFAVMVRDLTAAEQLAVLNGEERRQLTSPAGPIVIANAAPHSAVSTATSEMPTLGLMLPTTPLHALLLDRVQRPLVVTSGNAEGGVLAYRVDEAERDLAGVTDFFLHHDREIVRPIDDSVVRVIGDRPCVLRLARGLAPLRLPPVDCARPIIALGGQMKNAITLWNGLQAVLGPHVGDLDSVSVCSRWEEQLQALAALYGIDAREAAIVHDAHPDYFATQWSAAVSDRIAVQHHHAHVAAVMLEHQLEGSVLGLAWDGTGYGDDGTIWGGETLVATRRDYRRVASLRPFALPGGEHAIREPWRVAVALVAASLGADAARQLAWPQVAPEQIEQVLRLLARPNLSPRTSSVGRLFDAVAALAMGVSHIDDEGRSAMLLELVADENAVGAYSLQKAVYGGAIDELQRADWSRLIADVVLDVGRGETAGAIAMRFHRALADWAQSLVTEYEELPVVTSGGCFQNRLLRELMSERIGQRRSGYFEPMAIPPGDGGLAAGQLAIAAARLRTTHGGRSQ